MSSINSHYTFEYSQPPEYRFSHDSVFLARRVFEHCRGQDMREWRALDLCAGCGIVGLDFLWHCMQEAVAPPAHFDFVEVQDSYVAHFLKNRQHLPIQSLAFLPINYAELSTSYDLIVCNPPYFNLAQGKLSPSAFKNRCRFFIDSDAPTLWRTLFKSLAPGGRAFLLQRSRQQHGLDVRQDLARALGPHAQIQELEPVRGTSLLLISKSAEPSP